MHSPGTHEVAGPGLPGLTVRARIRSRSWAVQPTPPPPSPICNAQGGRQGTGPHVPCQLYPHPSPCHCGSGLRLPRALPPPHVGCGLEDKVAKPAEASGAGTQKEAWLRAAEICQDASPVFAEQHRWGRELLPPRLAQGRPTEPPTPTRTQHPKVLTDHTLSTTLTTSSKPGWDPREAWGHSLPKGPGLRGPVSQRSRAQWPLLSCPCPSAPGPRPSDPLSPSAVRSPQHKRQEKIPALRDVPSEGPSPVPLRSSDEGFCLTQMLNSLQPCWLSHTPQVALSFTCFVPQFILNEEALMQVGGGPFLGLGFRSDWGNLPRTPFPGTSLASGGSQPRPESTYKGLSTPV